MLVLFPACLASDLTLTLAGGGWFVALAVDDSLRIFSPSIVLSYLGDRGTSDILHTRILLDTTLPGHA